MGALFLMPIDPQRLAKLIETLETAGLHYHALGLADAVKATSGLQGVSPIELAATAAAKADWEVADRALTDYRASNH
jgi:hypothetical protein